jgi:hypothetical protein
MGWQCCAGWSSATGRGSSRGWIPMMETTPRSGSTSSWGCAIPRGHGSVRTVPLVQARSFGRFSLRDLAIASGELPPAPAWSRRKSAAIDGAFAESPVADLQATAQSVRESLEHLAAIETSTSARVGVAQAPSFSKLSGWSGRPTRSWWPVSNGAV